MKVTVSVLHNGEYIPIDTQGGTSDIDLDKVQQFLQTLKDGEIRDIKIDYSSEYYTFKGKVNIVKATDEAVEAKIIIMSAPVEHIKEQT